MDHPAHPTSPGREPALNDTVPTRNGSTPTRLFARLRKALGRCVIASMAALTLLAAPMARAHNDPSAASAGSSIALSALPVASVSLAAASTVAVGASAVTTAATVLSSAAQWTVLSVTASVDGTVWLLERATDGLRITTRLSRETARTLSVASGQSLTVLPVHGGWLIGQRGVALAWVPDPDAADLSFLDILPSLKEGDSYGAMHEKPPA